jgi:hypothetical protein
VAVSLITIHPLALTVTPLSTHTRAGQGASRAAVLGPVGPLFHPIARDQHVSRQRFAPALHAPQTVSVGPVPNAGHALSGLARSLRLVLGSAPLAPGLDLTSFAAFTLTGAESVGHRTFRPVRNARQTSIFLLSRYFESLAVHSPAPCAHFLCTCV